MTLSEITNPSLKQTFFRILGNAEAYDIENLKSAKELKIKNVDGSEETIKYVRTNIKMNENDTEVFYRIKKGNNWKLCTQAEADAIFSKKVE